MNNANYTQSRNGDVVELADTSVLGTGIARCEGSSPFAPTRSRLVVTLVSTPDLLVSKTSESNNTRRLKFVARDVAFDKDVAKVSEEKLSWAWFFREWLVLGTSIERCEGSSPFSPTNKLKNYESYSRK